MRIVKLLWMVISLVGIFALSGIASMADTEGYWRFEEAGGTTVVDWGPNGLDGTLNALPFRSTDVAVDPVPSVNFANTKSLDLNWQGTSSGGFLTVPVTGYELTLGNQNFTIEAWVRLDQLSDTSSHDQRQYLCMKKQLSSSDELLDYAVLAQMGNNDTLSPNYGKTSGFTGRELQLVFGGGYAFPIWGVTSNLEINDTGWHFVSVAYDTYNNVVRFGIDGTFETIPFLDNTKAVNDGPLRVGSHQNSSGTDNQFLRGSIDELRISRRFLPPEHLLNAPLLDCNGNGVSDLQDLFESTSDDCNGDFIPDECGIAGGTSEDCQPDGVPDECQLGTSVELAYDPDNWALAWRADEPYMAWLNRFVVEENAGVVDAIEVVYGIMAPGTEVDAYVWSDPDGDGNPRDAQVLWTGTVTVQQTEFFSTIDVPEIEIGGSGASFFLGFIMPVTDQDFPASMNIYGGLAPHRSWGVGSNSPLDPNDLRKAAVEFGTIDELLFAGNWVIRALMTGPGNDCNGNGVPDDCDIAEGFSMDSDGNGVPDECEDCNDNGVLDSDDIAGGTSTDCDGDGVPDECQLASGDCNADGVPDVCQLEGYDCNGNGVLDGCDIAGGFSADDDGNGVPDECEDCNGNGVLDSADIAGGSSEDCNNDGVPDECQFGDPATPLVYAWDDGSKESNLGFVGATLDLAWMNHFTVQPGGEWISAIEVVWGDTYPGMPAEVVLWTDPNGDGEPSDAQVILTVNTMTMNVNTIVPIWNSVAIPPTYIGPAGTSFFAGVHFDDLYGSSVIALDIDDPLEGFWYAYADHGQLDLNDLTAVYLTNWTYSDCFVRAVGFDGELEHDCNLNEVLDVCDIDAGTSADDNGNGIPDECEEASGTVGAALTCVPSSGTVPFNTMMTVTLQNLYTGQSRRVAARINVTLANGNWFPSWRAGFTNIDAGSSFSRSWSQGIPVLGTVIGENSFALVAEDVTPAPYNQPPYPPAGDTATAQCSVEAFAP